MAARIIWDTVDPAQLTAYARAFNDEVLENEFGLQAWLPNELNEDLEYRLQRGGRRDVDVAEYQAFDTQPRMTGRQGFGSIRGDLVPLSRQIPLLEEERIRLRILNRNGGVEGRNGALLNAMFNDVELMVRAVQARVELARGQVLSTGKFTLAENGLMMEADFGMKSSHKPVAGTVWSNPAADIIGDLLAWTQLFVDDTGEEPGIIVANRTIFGHFYGNTAMRTALAGPSGTLPARLNNEMINALFAAYGLPPIMLYDTKVRVNGVQTRVIPVDRVLMLPAPGGSQVGSTQYGITAEAIEMAERGLILAQDMPGIVAIGLRNENPPQTFTLAKAIAVPALPAPDWVISADVL